MSEYVEKNPPVYYDSTDIMLYGNLALGRYNPFYKGGIGGSVQANIGFRDLQNELLLVAFKYSHGFSTPAPEIAIQKSLRFHTFDISLGWEHRFPLDNRNALYVGGGVGSSLHLLNTDPERNDGNDWRFFADVYAHFTPRFTTRLAEGVHLNIAPEFAVFFERDYDDAQSLVLGLQLRLLLGVRFDTKRAVVKDQVRHGVSPDVIKRADERASERRDQEAPLRDDDEKRVTEVEEVKRTFTHESEDERVTTVRYQVNDEDESKWTNVDRDSTIDFAEFDDGDVLHVQDSSDDGTTWSRTRTYVYDRTTGQWNETTLEEWKYDVHYYSTIREDGEPIDNVAFVWDEQEQMWVEYEPIEQHLDVDRYPYTTTRSNIRGLEQNVQFEDVIAGDGTRRSNVPFVYDVEEERWVELEGALPPVYDGYRKPSEFSALDIQYDSVFADDGTQDMWVEYEDGALAEFTAELDRASEELKELQIARIAAAEATARTTAMIDRGIEYYSVIDDDGTVLEDVPFVYNEEQDMWVELERIQRQLENERAVEAAAAAEVRTATEALHAAEVGRATEAARLAEAARATEAARQAEIARLAELARIAEEARLAEETILAEVARLAEEARIAEEARLAEEAKRAEEADLVVIMPITEVRADQEIQYYSVIADDGSVLENVPFVFDYDLEMWVEYEPVTEVRADQEIQYYSVIADDGSVLENVPFVYDYDLEMWVEYEPIVLEPTPLFVERAEEPAVPEARIIHGEVQYFSMIADDGSVLENVAFIWDSSQQMWVELEPIAAEPIPLFIASAEEPVVVEAPVVEEPTVVAPAPVVQATLEPVQEAPVVIEKAEDVKESGLVLTAGEEEEPGAVVVVKEKRRCPWWWILLLLLLLLLIFFAWYRYKNRKDETHGPDDPISSKPDSSTVPTMDKTIKTLWPNISDGINKGTKATATFFAKGYRGAKGWILGLVATAKAKPKAEPKPKAKPEVKVAPKAEPKVAPKVAAAIVVPPVVVERTRTGKTCTEAGVYHCSEHPERTVNMGEGKRFPPCRGDGRGHSAVWELTKE